MKCTCLIPTWQDACGAQPLVTLFEGRSLRYGAAIVDVQTAKITFASWQVWACDVDLRSMCVALSDSRAGTVFLVFSHQHA